MSSFGKIQLKVLLAHEDLAHAWTWWNSIQIFLKCTMWLVWVYFCLWNASLWEYFACLWSLIEIIDKNFKCTIVLQMMIVAKTLIKIAEWKCCSLFSFHFVFFNFEAHVRATAMETSSVKSSTHRLNKKWCPLG